MADDRNEIQQIKDVSDIVDVVGSYLPLRHAGGTYKGLCPFHDDQRPSFDVDPRRQRYRCWSCNKYGDVIQFVQEFERVDFRGALEILARRAGISLENAQASPLQRQRALMLDVMKWAAEQFHQCLLDAPVAEAARCYLGERKFTGETIRRFGLGFAPLSGEWLVQRATAAKVSLELLETLGLIAGRTERPGYYDRFRDRVMFPIRDTFGKPVGFGGRVLPSSPLSARGPKYYNSADTPLFSKSLNLFGIDQARQEAAKVGYLAVVEGYTDVLMAYQLGVRCVVATMGTALNARHVQQLRRNGVGRVVLVFDADAGGLTGVDRALEIFATEDVELAVATLPEGLDPYDLLVRDGADAFRQVLAGSVDALDFKLNRVLAHADGVEERRRAVDSVLRIIALAPELPGKEGAVKQELMVTRIAQRLALRDETVWARLNELRHSKRRQRPGRSEDAPPEEPKAPAPPHEKELLQVLLAEPALLEKVAAQIPPAEVQHPGLRKLYEGLLRLRFEGLSPELDLLRPRLENPRLAEKALEFQEVGLRNPDRQAWLEQILGRFAERRSLPIRHELQSRLQTAADHESAIDLLRQLQQRNKLLGY